jgi:hypothetical protein
MQSNLPASNNSSSEGWIPFNPGLNPVEAGNEHPWRSSNGSLIANTEERVVVQTDNFGTVPVFLDTKKGETLLNLAGESRQASPQAIDRAGFWELVIYGSCLSTRTPWQHVKQAPSSSNLVFERRTGSITYSPEPLLAPPKQEVPTAELLQRIGDRLESLCRDYWSLVGDGEILLPLSGGLDSRLLAAYLATTGDPSRIVAMTYALSPTSREVTLAREICRRLSIKRHIIHPTPRTLFKDQIQPFWDFFGGSVPPAHGHLHSFLKQYVGTRPPPLLVSGFFADAVAGFAAGPSDKAPALSDSGVFGRFQAGLEKLLVDSETSDTVINDLETVHGEWRQSELPVGFDEYIYLTIRQPKTFAPLLSLYRDCCPVAIPFADPDLARLYLSLPLGERRHKLVQRHLISARAPSVEGLGDVSSSVANATRRQRAQGSLRKWTSRACIALAILSGDSIRPTTPYWTEDLFGAMRKEARPALLATIKGLAAQGILSAGQAQRLRPKPRTSLDANYDVCLLGFYPLASSAIS